MKNIKTYQTVAEMQSDTDKAFPFLGEAVGNIEINKAEKIYIKTDAEMWGVDTSSWLNNNYVSILPDHQTVIFNAPIKTIKQTINTYEVKSMEIGGAERIENPSVRFHSEWEKISIKEPCKYIAGFDNFCVKELELPDTLEEVAWGAFAHHQLQAETLELPASIKFIDGMAFLSFQENNLKRVIFNSPETFKMREQAFAGLQLNYIEFNSPSVEFEGGGWFGCMEQGQLVIPRGSRENYQVLIEQLPQDWQIIEK